MIISKLGDSNFYISISIDIFPILILDWIKQKCK